MPIVLTKALIEEKSECFDRLFKKFFNVLENYVFKQQKPGKIYLLVFRIILAIEDS
jgi:hypothetical protein